MSDIAVIERRLTTLDSEKKDLLNAKLTAIGRRIIRCISCKKSSQLRLWTFIQDHWYERPYSCSGGDTWHTSKTELCHIVCPKCDTENYIYNHPQREKIINL